MATDDLISYFAFPFVRYPVSERDVALELHRQGFNVRAPSQRSQTTGLKPTVFWRQRLVWRQFDYLRERLLKV